MDPKDHRIDGGVTGAAADGPRDGPAVSAVCSSSRRGRRAPVVERRAGDRRHAERRNFLTLGGRRHHTDRRRHDRRLKLAGAGLLAAVAFGVGGHEIAARMDTPMMSIFGPSEPATSVDVTADFHLPAWDKEALEPFIQEAATVHGMSPSLIRAVIQTESRFNPLAVSRVGAQGLMQLMPTTARHVGIENPFDPRENILGGTKYLSTLLDRFKGNTAKALAPYNAGPDGGGAPSRPAALPRDAGLRAQDPEARPEHGRRSSRCPRPRWCARPRCAAGPRARPPSPATRPTARRPSAKRAGRTW
jgi:hypothetical protein